MGRGGGRSRVKTGGLLVLPRYGTVGAMVQYSWLVPWYRLCWGHGTVQLVGAMVQVVLVPCTVGWCHGIGCVGAMVQYIYVDARVQVVLVPRCCTVVLVPWHCTLVCLVPRYSTVGATVQYCCVGALLVPWYSTVVAMVLLMFGLMLLCYGLMLWTWGMDFRVWTSGMDFGYGLRVWTSGIDFGYGLRLRVWT